MHGIRITPAEPFDFPAAQRAFAVIQQREAVPGACLAVSSFLRHTEIPIATSPHLKVQQPVLK